MGIMDQVELKDVRIFVRVADLGGFAAAARSLRIAKSSVSRAIARLEAALDTQLLQRTPRNLLLTDAGQQYYDRVAAAIATINDASTQAAARDTPQGIIRLSAPPGVGTEALPQIIARFIERHPAVSIDVTLSSSQADLTEGGFDLAVRGGPQPDSALLMCKLLDTSFKLYAAPDYLQRAGAPQHPTDLPDHQCVLFRAPRGHTTWALRGPAGVFDVQVTGKVSSDGLAFVRRAAIAGLGIALLPEVPGQMAVESGWLAPVLPDYSTAADPLFVVYPAARHLPLRVKLFRQHLIDAFAAPHDLQKPHNIA